MKFLGWNVNNKSIREQTQSGNGMDISGILSPFRNWIRGQTGSGLTDAQIAQNDYQTQMANTQYQRGVADMEAAGLNPAMMYGAGGQPAPSGAGASPGSPAFSFQEAINALMLPKQLEQIKANIELAKSSADKNKADADLMRQNLDFNNQLFDLRKQGQELSNQLTSETIENTKVLRQEISENINLLQKKQLTEDEFKLLTAAQRNLADMQEKELATLLPYKQKELTARTVQEEAAAKFSAVQAGIQSGLWRMGYFDAQFEDLQEAIRQRSTSADAQEVIKGINELRLKMANGEFIDTNAFKWWQLGKRIDAQAMNKFYQYISTAAIAVNGNPLGAAASVGSAAVMK